MKRRAKQRRFLMKKKGWNYFVCKRFFPAEHPYYPAFSGLDRREIVSVDCVLFPYLEWKAYKENDGLSPDEQALAVVMLTEKEMPPSPEGFVFCGFDIAGGGEFQDNAGISALVDCGADAFPEVFTNEDLNRYGLIDDLEKAWRIKELLPEKYPDEPHACCEVYAICRKTAALN